MNRSITARLANPAATPADSAEVLVIAAHPALERSRVNRRLIEAIRAGADPQAGGTALPRIAVRDLYALYPDYLIDVEAEQSALGAARLVVWQHPIHWYGMPPLMKLWLDEVLTLGWAYGSGGDALRGKDLWLVVSTGGAEDAYRPGGYNRYFFDAFMPPYEQTAALCGLRFLPPLVLHGAQVVGEDDLKAHAAAYRERLISHPDWPEMDQLAACPSCVVPTGDRPS